MNLKMLGDPNFSYSLLCQTFFHIFNSISHQPSFIANNQLFYRKYGGVGWQTPLLPAPNPHALHGLSLPSSHREMASSGFLVSLLHPITSTSLFMVSSEHQKQPIFLSS
jgi:hypothetical protein